MIEKQSFHREIKLLGFVWKMARGQQFKIVMAFVAGIISALIPASAAFIIKNSIDSNYNDISGLLDDNELETFVIIIVCGVVCSLVARLLNGLAMPAIKRNVDVEYIKRISKMRYSYIADKTDNSAVMGISIESDMIASLIPMVYHSFIKAPITIAAFVFVLMISSVKLTIVALLLALMIAVGVFLYRNKVKSMTKESFDKMGDMHRLFNELLTGYKIFLVSDALSYMKNKLVDMSRKVCSLKQNTTKVTVIQAFVIEILTVIITIVFIVVAKNNTVVSDSLSVSNMLLFPTAILYIRSEILKVAYGYSQLSRTESATKRVMNIITKDNVEGSEMEEFKSKIESISVENVTFSYVKESAIVKNVSCKFEKSGINCIVGRSGEGKTTLINLCMGLRRPEKGRIYYNDYDIVEGTKLDLYGKIALIEQEPFVFEGSLYDNIFLGRDGDETKALCLLKELQLSYLAETVSELKNNMIGGRYRKLSTGEKQRLSVIRALVRDIDVLFLDEATSNIDLNNANILIGFVKNIAKDKLVISVSHDETFISNADNVFVLDNGTITKRN